MKRSEVLTAALVSCFIVGGVLIVSSIWKPWEPRQVSREVVQGDIGKFAANVIEHEKMRNTKRPRRESEEKRKFRESMIEGIERNKARLTKLKDPKQIERTNRYIKIYEGFLKKSLPEKTRRDNES